jgi:hypothetical protein
LIFDVVLKHQTAAFQQGMIKQQDRANTQRKN